VLGPLLRGASGVSLAPPTPEDHRLYRAWAAQPEITYFWGPRGGNWTDTDLEERYKKLASDPNGVQWTIQVDGRSVGLTGIDGIDWIRRQGESYILVGDLAVQRRGVASEAVRLRTDFAFRELNLHRVYNWIVLDNIGSRRANEKAGYVQQGIAPNGFRRGVRLHDEWLGELLRESWERRAKG